MNLARPIENEIDFFFDSFQVVNRLLKTDTRRQANRNTLKLTEVEALNIEK